MEDDLEFETLLHQKELERALVKISDILESKNNDSINIALDKQTEAFTDAIQSLPSSDVTVEIDQAVVVSSIEQMAIDILKGQQILVEATERQIEDQKKIITLIQDQIQEAQKMREWVFDFQKNNSGELIQSTAKQIK